MTAPPHRLPPLSIHDVHGAVDVAIITVRLDEYEAMEALLPGARSIEGGNNAYESGTFQDGAGNDVRVALTRCVVQGNGEAQGVASNIISDLDPAWIFLVGIAGGVPDFEYSLGDVVIASKLHDYSFGGAASGGVTYEVGGGRMSREVDRFLQTRIAGHHGATLRAAAGFEESGALWKHPSVPSGEPLLQSTYGDEASRQKLAQCIARRFPAGRRDGPVRIHAGPCANGNLVVKDTALIEQWKQASRQITHVETELAGVYQAAATAGREGYPVLAIRGLSDIVGLRRDADWTQYACNTAAAAAAAILKSGSIDFGRRPPHP